jgi:hypothetical protein
MTSQPPAPTPPATPTKSFSVPDYLKVDGIGVTEITLEQRNLVFRYKASKHMKGDFKVLLTGKWDTDLYQLKSRAAKKGFSPENIEQLAKGFGQIYSSEAAEIIAGIKHTSIKEAESRKTFKAANSDGEKAPKVIKYYVQKYHDSSNGNELHEAVLIGREACFVCIDRDKKGDNPAVRLSRGFSIPNSATNTIIEILPKEELGYLSKPYQFESERELVEYLNKAVGKSLDNVYQDVEKISKKYIAASDTHHTVVAGDVVFTYFQDIFGQTHYLYFYGDNGTGKSNNLQLISEIGYRAMYDIDITPANIYTYLGSIEPGQGIILEDEADDLDYKQQEKMKIYKKGYNTGGKVSRTETGGDSGRQQDGYYVYGFKAFTGEEKLDPDYAKGFNERTFYVKCQEGNPEYDLSEVTNPAGSEVFEGLRQELEDMHKTLLAFRLIHHTDRFPDVGLLVKNREKQLVKPLIRLFQGTKCLAEIASALGELLSERRGLKQNTLEYHIYRVIDRLITELKRHEQKGEQEQQQQLQQAYTFKAQRVYIELREELDGHYRDEAKDQSFETPNHGKVSHKKINSICEDRFGGKKSHTRDGYQFTFVKEDFDKVKQAYSLDGGTTVKILKEVSSNNVGESVKVVQVPRDKEGFSRKNNGGDDEIQTETDEELEESEAIEQEDVDFEEWVV